MAQNKVNSGSLTARKTAARLAAVQALYQAKANDQSTSSVIDEYKAHRLGKMVEGNEMVLPDGVLFTAILQGVESRDADLRSIIDTFLASSSGAKASKTLGSMDPLLESILLCGSFELLAHHEYDAPIIISDYIDVTHAFYEGNESKIVNAALDHVMRAVR